MTLPSPLRQFVESSPDGVVVLDADASIVDVNRPLQQLIGGPTVRELRGSTFATFVAEADRTRTTALLVGVATGARRSASFDATLLDGDRRRVPCTLGATRVGHHTLVVAHDLSARIRRDEERTRLAEHLARVQRLETAGQLAGALAHDLNNILGVMRANLDLATESAHAATSKAGNLAEVLYEDLDELRAALDSAERLTERLLGFARTEPDEAASADVELVVHGVERLIRRSLPEGVEFGVAVAADLPAVAVAPARLEQGLVNLVMNARDAVGEDGRINVIASAVEDVDPTMQWAPAVRVEVNDDGDGMTDNVRVRAFEPLFTTKGSGGGTGLGLSSVLALAHEAGGDVQLTSRPGLGTSVGLLLPAARDNEPSPDRRDEPVGGVRVLVATPRSDAAGAIEAMLQSAGYRVSSARDAAQADDAITSGGVAVALLDIAWPGEHVTRLAGRAADAGVAVAFLSSGDGPDTLDGIAVLTYPFSTSRLLDALTEALAAT